MNTIIEVKAFNPELEGKLISIVGSSWCRYFFVTNVRSDELDLVNDAGETVELEVDEVERKNIVITVIELPKLTKSSNE